jgi:hypothetical protein
MVMLAATSTKKPRENHRVAKSRYCTRADTHLTGDASDKSVQCGASQTSGGLQKYLERLAAKQNKIDNASAFSSALVAERIGQFTARRKFH